MKPTLDYVVHGPEHAPWLTLSHPIGAHRHIWDGLIPRLAQHYRVLSCTTRGHDPAGSAEGGMDALTDDVLQLWQTLGIQRSHVLGLSLGGCIGVALALHVPERVHSLTVACARLEMDAAATDMWQQRARLVEQQGMAPVVEPTLQRWFTPEFLARQPASVEAVRQMLQACPPADFASCARALAGLHLAARLPDLRVPTLFIAGRHDQAVMPSQIEHYAGLTPGAGSVTLDGPHILHLENPDGFGHTVLDFLARHAAP